MMITNIADLDLNGTYSYADYLQWRFDETVELIKGKIFKMSPAPNVKHQRISWNLTHIFSNYFWKKPCSAFAAPFDVRLYDAKKSSKNNKDIFTVVQPDICIICDEEKIDDLGCIGAPDLIIEILSKGNSNKEMKNKYELYEENGVKEYWIVFPYEEVLQQIVLGADGKYFTYKNYSGDDIATSTIFEGLEIPLENIFS